MADFSSTSRFRVSMVSADGASERVSVQIGLDGLKISEASSGRALRSYELGHISRWQSRGSSLVLYTRTPVDVEERQLTLQGDDYTIRSVLDTLTCSCLQLAELLQSKQSTDAQETANSLHALVAGDGKKKTKLPSADDVEFWKDPAMEGWLQCQGEVMKSWRKRWFVLKQGYLFRFMNASVTKDSKPRGVVDLSKIQDVAQANKTTGRALSFQLKTATGGSVAYLCDSETDLVMWMSAVNREVEKIVKTLAGVEEEPPAPAPARPAVTAAAPGAVGGGKAGPAGVTSEWMRQLERSFDALTPSGAPLNPAVSRGGGGNGRADIRDYDSGSLSGPAMVDVVGYESIGGGGGGGGGGGSGRDDRRASGRPGRDAYTDAYGGGGGGGGNNGSGLGYGNIAGIAGVASGAGAGGLSLDTLANYGTLPSSASGGAAPARNNSYGHGAGYGAAPEATSYGSGAYGAGTYGAPAGNGGYGGAGGYGGGAYGTGAASQQQGGYGGGAQPVQQHAPGGGGGSVSLIDQVPNSQPAYPYYQQGMAQAASGGAAPSPQWQVHHTPEGRPYYYNTSTGTTQWEPPPGF